MGVTAKFSQTASNMPGRCFLQYHILLFEETAAKTKPRNLLQKYKKLCVQKLLSSCQVEVHPLTSVKKGLVTWGCKHPDDLGSMCRHCENSPKRTGVACLHVFVTNLRSSLRSQLLKSISTPGDTQTPRRPKAGIVRSHRCGRTVRWRGASLASRRTDRETLLWSWRRLEHSK